MARCWVQQETKDGRSRANDTDRTCVIIVAILDVPDDQYLDIEATGIRRSVATLVARLRREKKQPVDRSRVFDMIVNQYQTAENRRVAVLEAMNPVPLGDCRGYDRHSLGNPRVLVALDTSVIVPIEPEDWRE